MVLVILCFYQKNEKKYKKQKNKKILKIKKKEVNIIEPVKKTKFLIKIRCKSMLSVTSKDVS